MSRGPHPDDAALFAPSRVPTLRRAAEEVSWLLGRGYSPETAIAAAGNHHQLTLRQRIAVARSCSSDAACQARVARCRRSSDAAGQTLSIDGFNLVIALEVALAGGLLVRGREGALRDLAGLRGTYRIAQQTENAVAAIGRRLSSHPPAQVVLLLDRQVSNSGRLKALLDAHGAGWPFPVVTELVPNPDPVLSARDWVVTGDAMILDRCGPWVNLASEIVGSEMPGAWVINLGV